MLSKNLFDEKALEVNAISNYLTADTPLPQYLPYARFLLDTDLSHTAKLLYALLLDRATLSQKNNWMDECGFVYVIFPLPSLSDALRCSTMSIKRALRSLEDADLMIQGSTGKVTYQYQIWNEEQQQWLDMEDAPVNAGKYKVVVTVAADTNYHSASVEKEFIISYGPLMTRDHPIIM